MDMEQTRLNFANSWAFIVGINDYANIPSLKTAVNDAERIAEVLTESHHFQLGALLKNPGKSDLMTLLEETLPATVKKEDRVFVYFAGHGIAADGDEGPTGQLVPADANPDDIHSFVPMDLLNRKLNDLPCRHLLLVLDCCFSGAFKWSTTHRAVGRLVPKKLYAERFDRFLVDPAWQVITSAAYDQKALDFLRNKDADVRGAVVSDDDGRQHSPFAKALIDGLDGAADARVEHDQEGDGVITATELYSYIRNSVEPRTIAEDEKMRQTPGFFPLANHNKGEFIFLHPRHRLNLPPRPRRSPYPGARSFSLGDRELFYGREKASQDLFNKVISAPMTVVSGPSGSGKSSLVFAGLSPRLAEALWKILPPLRVNRDPVAGLNAVFNQLRIWEITDGGAEKLAGLGLPARFTEKLKTMKGQRYLGADYMLSVFRHISGYHATFGSWEEHLLHEIESKPFLETPLGPAEGIPPRLINALKQDRYVLQADQWDNLYSDCEDEDLRRRFQENLVTLLEEAGPEHFRLVLTVGDARKSLLKEGPLAPFLKGAEFPVPPMTLEEMKEAVVMPTVQEVLIFDPPELVDQLVQEVYRSPGALPLLSVTLADLYGEYEQSGREDRALTGRDYLAMGGVSGMVRQRARNIYEKALQQSFRLTPEVLERLVAAGLHPASGQSLEKLLYEEYINRRKFLEAVARHAGFVLSARDSAAIDADLSEAEKMQIAEVNDRFFPNREALVKALEAAHARPFAPARLEAIVAVADQAGRFSDTILEEATGSLDGYYVINGSVFKILESQGVESHILGALDDLRNVLFESRVEFRKALERPLAPYYPGPAGPAAQDAMVQKLVRISQSFYYQDTMEKVMLRMVALDGGEPSGRPVSYRELVFREAQTNRRREDILDMLTDARLVVRQAEGVTLAYPELVRSWKVLWRWVSRVGEDRLIMRNRLYDQARQYALKPHSGNLIKEDDPRLDILALDLQQPNNWMNDAERTLVESSLHARERARIWRRRITIGVLSVISSLLILALIYLFQVKALKYYDDNFSKANQLEEKAGRPIESQDTRELQQSWLYTLAALGRDIDPSKTLNISQGRLIRQGISAGIYNQLWSSPGALAGINDVEFSPDGSLMALGCTDGLVRVCEVNSARELLSFAGHEQEITDLSFHPTLPWLASASKDSTVRIWHIGESRGEGLTRDASGDSLLGILKGHTNTVRSVAFSPDGLTLASSGKDRRIILWDVSDELLLRDRPRSLTDSTSGEFSADSLRARAIITPESGGPRGDIWQLRYDHQGGRLVCAALDSSLRLWQLDGSGVPDGPPAVLRTGNSVFWSAAFSPDDRFLAAGAQDSVVRIWSLPNLDLVRSLRGHPGAITEVDFNRSGSLMASADDRGEIRLWDAAVDTSTGLPGGSILDTLSGHTGPVWSVAFSPASDALLASGSGDHSFRLWNAGTGAEVAAPAGHWARVNTVSVSADDRFLVSGAGDGNILIWDRHSGHQLRRIHAHRGAVRDLSFARTDGGDYLLFSAGADGTLKSFRWHSDSLAALADFRETEHPEISRPRHSLSSLAVQQDSALLALGWEDGRLDVQAYFPQAEQTHLVLLGTSRLHQHAVESLAFNPRRGQLASGDGSGNVILWTVNHQDSLWPNLRWAAHERGVSALAFHPRKNMLATGGEDDDIRLWSLGGLRDYQAFAPDEEEGITFGLRRTTRYIFNSRSVQELRKIGVSDSLINALNNPAFRDRAFYGEQNYWDALEKQAGNLDLVDNYRYVLLKYTSRNEVQRMTDFHPRSGRNSVIDFLEILTGHEDDIYALAFSADGQLLASASGDETIRLWNVNAASEIISLEGHQDNVHDLAFLHDQHNRILASASWDCTVRLWDALEGATLDTLIANEVPVRQLAFSPNGRYLLSAGEEGVLNRWTINHRGDAVDKNFRIIGGSILLSLAFDPKGDHFALGSKDNFVRQASVEDMRTATLPRQLGDVLSVAYNVRRFGPENTHYLLAAASSDSTLRIWDYRKKVLLVEKKVHKDKVRSVAFSPRGNLLATGGSDRMVYIWRLVQQNGKFDLIREYSYDDHNSGVWSVAFSPDGNTVASGSWDNTIHLWNFRTDRSRRLIGHRGPVLTVAFSPDGRRLASGSWDQTVRLWDTRSGGELDVITSHRGPVSSVAFSPDGKSLASGSRDRTIRLRHLNYLSSFAVNNKKQVESQIREARREGNMSARLRDLEYLALDSAFVAENQSFRLLDYAGDIYSDLLSQEWHNPTALRQAPTRFYLSVEDTALPVFKTHSSSLANTPRPVEVGPLQWVLESMPEGEKEKRRRRQAKSYWNNVWEDIWRRRGE